MLAGNIVEQGAQVKGKGTHHESKKDQGPVGRGSCQTEGSEHWLEVNEPAKDVQP